MIQRLLLTFVIVTASALQREDHRVTELPGVDINAFNASHYSGYLSVQASPTVRSNVFYYYVQHPDPSKPLLVWMNGGPGASSLMGFFTELGPLLLNARSLPSGPAATNGAGGASRDWHLHANPFAWSQEASLLVWEQPAGVG